jgi:hypothetical protein
MEVGSERGSLRSVVGSCGGSLEASRVGSLVVSLVVSCVLPSLRMDSLDGCGGAVGHPTKANPSNANKHQPISLDSAWCGGREKGRNCLRTMLPLHCWSQSLYVYYEYSMCIGCLLVEMSAVRKIVFL